MNVRGAVGAIRRKAVLFRRAAEWFDVFRGVNKIYYEVSLEQLAAEAERVSRPESAPSSARSEAQPSEVDGPDAGTAPPPVDRHR